MAIAVVFYAIAEQKIYGMRYKPAGWCAYCDLCKNSVFLTSRPERLPPRRILVWLCFKEPAGADREAMHPPPGQQTQITVDTVVPLSNWNAFEVNPLQRTVPSLPTLKACFDTMDT